MYLATVNLVMGCPNARAGVGIEQPLEPLEPLEQPTFDPITNYH